MDLLKSILPRRPASQSEYRTVDGEEVDLPLISSSARSASPSSRSSATTRSRRWPPLLGSSVYFVVLHILLLAAVGSLLLPSRTPPAVRAPSSPYVPPPPPEHLPPPIIDASPDAGNQTKSGMYDLSPEGLAKFGVDAMYERQSTTLRQAKARYELKTGRKTPLGYEKWFVWVKERGLLVDEYDQIYKDFAPFYDLKSPHHVRKTIQQDVQTAINEGRRLIAFNSKTDGQVQRPSGGGPFSEYWEEILRLFAKDIPDFDVVFNYQDEPRVVFNARDPDMVKKAYDLNDPEAYRRGPHPTSDYYLRDGKCKFVNSPTGLARLANDENAFLLSSPSTGFTENLRPVLSQTKIEPCFADILVPSIYYYQRANWGPKDAITNPDWIPWEDKKPMLWWRGQTSGGNMEGTNYRHFQRFRFITKANARPDIIDAAFTNLDYCLEVCDQVREEFPLSERKTWTDAYPYKYIFDIDGNTFSGRFMGLLHGKSLIFKSTIWTEFFSMWLKPYVHYIPVLPDLGDLYEKVDWAITHDLEAQRIQAAGAEFVKRVITDEQMDAYYYAVLLEYAEIQRGWNLADGGGAVEDVEERRS